MYKNNKPDFKFNYVYNESDDLLDFKIIMEKLFKKFLIEYNK